MRLATAYLTMMISMPTLENPIGSLGLYHGHFAYTGGEEGEEDELSCECRFREVITAVQS